MIKLPFEREHTTDDQDLYDDQVNEELKYCNCSNFVVKFVKKGGDKRAFVIRTKEDKLILVEFQTSNYKGINEALELIRLNLVLARKENEIPHSTDAGVTLDTDSRLSTTVKLNNGDEHIFTISTVEQLRVNDKPLKSKAEIIKRLIELSTQHGDGEPYLDFVEAEYDAGIQAYLILSLYKDSINLDDQLVESIRFFKYKEPKIYYVINSFLRGNFDELFEYLDSIGQSFSVCSIAILCQNIIQALEELPDRSHDIMIYRAGLGVNKNKTIGAQNTYESFVSFGTSGGKTEQDEQRSSKPILYKRILRKNEKAIPADLIENIGLYYTDGAQENEFLLPPFNFRITGIENGEQFDTISIEETSSIDPRRLLDRRLDEIEGYLKEKNDNKQYELIKGKRDQITKKAERGKQMANIKDIYFGLRPKTRISIRNLFTGR